MKYKAVIIMLLAILLSQLIFADENITVIADIKNWKHPTKEVFENNNMVLWKIELRDKRRYPIFYVKNDKEVNIYDYKTLSDIAESNGFWDYMVVKESEYVKVFCNKIKKRVVKTESNKAKKEYDSNSLKDAIDKAKRLVANREKLIYKKKTGDYYSEEYGEDIFLNCMGFDENGRVEVRVQPRENFLNVYKYYHVDLKTEELFEE